MGIDIENPGADSAALLAALLALVGGSVGRILAVDQFAASSPTFALQAGCTSILAIAIGGGGGGGGVGSTAGNGFGGIGGIGQCRIGAFDVSDVTELNITVGGSASAGASGNNAGATGTDTTIVKGSTTLIEAKGGTGGAGSSGSGTGASGSTPSDANGSGGILLRGTTNLPNSNIGAFRSTGAPPLFFHPLANVVANGDGLGGGTMNGRGIGGMGGVDTGTTPRGGGSGVGGFVVIIQFGNLEA